MIVYRKAGPEDAEKIARLHAANWRAHYRGILDDHYLDHEVHEDRKKVWRDRLQFPKPSMILTLGEEGSKLIGFGCVFLEDSSEYGALLDNLHVSVDFARRGIGRRLMSVLAKDILQKSERRDMYLWVLKENIQAIQFYDRCHGLRKEQVTENELGNQPVEKLRYYWPDVEELVINHSILD
jgi:ribosomal protein S18 acetylase RimI-like enzyme